jgi:hypothetical protein
VGYRAAALAEWEAASGRAGRFVVRTPHYATLDVNIRRLRVFSSRVNAFLTIENAFDGRYLNINSGAYADPEQLMGVPQNPRRLTVCIDFRVWR